MIHPLETDYEREERDALISLARPGDVLYDVGAYVGWYSVEFAKRVPMSKVYAFEPIPENLRELDKNISELGNVRAYAVGVSDKDGWAEFHVSEREPGTASMAPLEEDRFGPTTIKEWFIISLDSAQSLLPPNFIKIDVEGAELLVLKGAKQTLLKHRPIVQCEMLRKWSRRFNYHPNDIIDYMATLDYDCFKINGEPFLTMTDDTPEKNFFFLPRLR